MKFFVVTTTGYYWQAIKSFVKFVNRQHKYVWSCVEKLKYRIINRMFKLWKKILEHVKDYCEEAAIHGLRHIVSQRLAIFERSVSLGMDMKLLQTHHMCCSKATVLKFYTL